MKLISVGGVLAAAMLLTSLSSQAGGARKAPRSDPQHGSSMQVVANGSAAGQPGYRWRYFVDSRRGHAVVISPGGDYFYSRGKGLTLVYKGTPGADAG